MNLSTWMSSVKQSAPLSNLSIPGTHDSCALYDHATAGYTQCQWLGIKEQLQNGIRFLDIRPTYELEGKPFEITHGGWDQYITFAEVQTQVVDFLKANPSEVVLMNVQQEYSLEKNSSFVARFDQIVSGYEDYWFFEDRIPTVEEARGRIVLIRGYDPSSFHPDAPTNGGWLTDKGIPWNALTQDGLSKNDYFRTQNASTAYEADKKKAIEHMIDQGAIDGRLAVNFLSYAHAGATPGNNAKEMNPDICRYIAARSLRSIVGVLPMDFATNTPGFIEEIIRNNLQWGEVVAADFFGSKQEETALFLDRGDNTTSLSLFSRAPDGSLQLREVWNSGPGNWQATRICKVLTGDFSGTGKAEIAVFYDYPENRTGLWLFAAAADGSFQARQVWDSGPGNWSASPMSDVVAGDFSGTGKTEIAVFYRYPFNQTGLWLFSLVSGSMQPRKVWDSGFGNWNAGHMSRVVVGDFSGTGRAEIAVFYNYYNNRTGLWLFAAADDGSFQHRRVWDSGDGTWNAGHMSNVVAGDFSGTGKVEIAVFYRYPDNHTGLWMFPVTSGAVQPRQAWDSGVGHWGSSFMSRVVTGDFSGTGKVEIAVFFNYPDARTGLWLFSTAGDGSAKPRRVWDSGVDNWLATAMYEIMVGDFSGSGKAEITTFYAYNLSTTGVWTFSATSGDSFVPRMLWKGELNPPAAT